MRYDVVVLGVCCGGDYLRQLVVARLMKEEAPFEEEADVRPMEDDAPFDEEGLDSPEETLPETQAAEEPRPVEEDQRSFLESLFHVRIFHAPRVPVD